MTTLDHAGTADPDTLAASGRFPAGPPAPFAPPEQGPARARGRLTGVDAARGLAVIGMIVAHVAMPFLLAGMAIGRLDLVRSAGRLIVGGPVGAALGYRGSWLAVDVLGGRQPLLNAVAPVAGKLAIPADQVLEQLSSSSYGTVAATGWRSLVGRGPLETMLHTASARAGGAR